MRTLPRPLQALTVALVSVLVICAFTTFAAASPEPPHDAVASVRAGLVPTSEATASPAQLAPRADGYNATAKVTPAVSRDEALTAARTETPGRNQIARQRVSPSNERLNVYDEPALDLRLNRSDL
jgi:hypothetical protein